jgi:hypothetical protein
VPPAAAGSVEQPWEVVATTGPRIEPVVTEELGDGTTPQRVLCPFDLQVWAVDRMLNVEITHDPPLRGPGAPGVR